MYRYPSGYPILVWTTLVAIAASTKFGPSQTEIGPMLSTVSETVSEPLPVTPSKSPSRALPGQAPKQNLSKPTAARDTSFPKKDHCFSLTRIKSGSPNGVIPKLITRRPSKNGCVG